MKKRPFCMDCRTVLRGVHLDECPGGDKHRVLDLCRKADVERLRSEVWGPADWRRQKRALARAGGGGATLGGLGDVASCGACDLGDVGGLGEAVGAIIVVLAVALFAVVLVWLIGKVIGYFRARAARPKPHGALLPPGRLLSKRRLVGTVVGVPRGSPPLSLEPASGWALELTCKRFVGNAVMLRDGESFGFDVRSEDGRTVHVPRGMLRLARGGETETPIDALLADHVTEIDGGAWRADDDLAPIPFERGQSIELRPGDRIELIATMDAADSGYRDGRGSMLTVRGVASVRKVGGNRELPPPSQET